MPDPAGRPFIHDDKETFAAALVLAEARLKNVARALIEKDYWVTHTLDALQRAGFVVHFKGGTSLSKGFGLIERFSEDLDVKLEGAFLPPELSKNAWNSHEPKHRKKRREFFDAILKHPVGDLKLIEEPSFHDEHLRNFGIAVHYPRTVADSPHLMRNYVLLEVGRARVTPFVERPITSWVHEQLRIAKKLDDFASNEPTIRCVHPLVTLLEKMNALVQRADHNAGIKQRVDELTKQQMEAARIAASEPGGEARAFGAGGVYPPPSLYIRHYEDAACIARAFAAGKLPPLPTEFPLPRALAEALVASHNIKALPSSSHAAFNIDSAAIGRAALQRAHADLQAFDWGERVSLDDCTTAIRDFITQHV